jgi:ABC-2 type transport system ATP-binding protein
MSAISLSGLSKRFKQKKASIEALKDVSLTVEQGEVFGFVGPNGAGKSTTIKIMLDIINDYRGEARIFGISTRDSAARRQAGYVPESPALYEQLSPLEILRAGLSLHQIHRDDAESWCMHWLERFSIAQNARRPLRQLSKGTGQRVALAHAMVVSPRLLILDEPLSGLDPVGRKDVVDILADYQRSGGTVFLTSHVLHDVERLADRFGLIHQGELKTIQSPNELVGDDELVTVRSAGSHPVPRMTAESGGRWFIELRRSELWSALRDIEVAGHQLIEIKPTLSLESAFMRYLGLGGGSDHKP